MEMNLSKKKASRNTGFVLLVLSLAISALSWFTISEMGYSWWIAAMDTFFFFGLIILFTSVISVIQRYYHASSVTNLPYIGTIVLFSTLTVVFNWLLIKLFIQIASFQDLAFDLILVKVLVALLFFIIATALYWIDQQRIQEERIKQYAVAKEREAIKIELNSMQQQFKPHFLFNSLNSISALSIADPEKARKMIHLLSEFMRKAVREHESELINLGEEIQHIQRYTEIEKIRFGHRLNVDYQVNLDQLNDTKVPSLILQPIIENAIKYGLYGNLDEVTIKIEINQEEDYLDIEVRNPFDEESRTSSSGTGYGLLSIEKKLLLIYQRADLLHTETEGNEFITRLKIPQS